METKANFVLIGAVTLLGLLGLLGLLIWFAKLEIDRQFAWYETTFEDVSGLGMAGDVRYNGLAVGQVVDIKLDPVNPSQVRVRMEVDAGTPIKTDTVAQLNSQGVTGVAFVALTGGSPAAPLLTQVTDTDEIPLIRSERSVVQALTEDAPDLVEEAVEAIREIRSFLSDDNQAAVSDTLANVAAASGQLEQALRDFSEISQTISQGTQEIAKFTANLDEIGQTVQITLEKVGETLDVAKVAIAEIEPTLQSANQAFASADTAISGVGAFMQERAPQVADDLSAAIQSLEQATVELSARAEAVLEQFGGTSDLASARLTEVEATIATLDQTLLDTSSALEAVETASDSFLGLVDGDGAALLSEGRLTLQDVRETVAVLRASVEQDVPAILGDIRGAVATATEVFDRVGADLTGFTQRLDPLLDTGDETLRTATETLRNANDTMAAIDRALVAAEDTLAVAGATFSDARQVIGSDLGPAIADMRSAAGQIEATMATLSQDIPGISEDLRNAAAQALEVMRNINRTVSGATPPITAFAQQGLPEFTAFAEQSQQLVRRFDSILRKLERDPARFFFGNNPPEFRR